MDNLGVAMSNALFRVLSLIGAYKIYEKALLKQIKSNELPSHVAFILDGNRRWARKRGLPPWYGHEQGAKKAEQVLKWCLELGIKTVSLYVLSTENLKRKPEEVAKILELVEKYLERALNEELFDKYKVKVKALGKIDLLPPSLQEKIKALEKKTANYSNHYLNICIAYGGRREIVDAVKKICRDVLEGKIKLEQINEELVKKYLYTSHLPNPEPDLVIRTSGEARISNFLLYQVAYSELLFLDVYWPDFRKIDLLRAIRIYQQRNRRFGR